VISRIRKLGLVLEGGCLEELTEKYCEGIWEGVIGL